MLAFSLPGTVKPGDTLDDVTINGELRRVSWSADERYIILHRSETLAPGIEMEGEDRREIISTSSPGPHGLRQFWFEDEQFKFVITYRTEGKITVEAADATEARTKFENGDATAAEWATDQHQTTILEVTPDE